MLPCHRCPTSVAARHHSAWRPTRVSGSIGTKTYHLVGASLENLVECLASRLGEHGGAMVAGRLHEASRLTEALQNKEGRACRTI